ncbi:MAG: VWA domain-containing protein, partial [Planctomycetia bacterium]|nr:VWA domain-containing protein [Planctomycetia bacterium]
MPSFAYPWFLLLLPLVPLIVWRWVTRPRPAIRHSSTDLLVKLPGGRERWVQRVGIIVRSAVLTLLVLGLGGPRWPDQSTRIPTEGIAIAMLVDVSGSMAEDDFDWNEQPITRLEAVKRAFKLFVQGGEGPDGETLEGRPGDLISLIAFATRPETLCPLTLSHRVPVQQLEKLEPRGVPGESETNISDAIVEGLHRLNQAGDKRKVIVLLSDGDQTVSDPRSRYTPRQAAQLAGSLGIPIYAIDAGGAKASQSEAAPPGAPVGQEVGLQKLREIARITNGECFPAHDTASLLAVCRKIDALERARIESYQYR